MGAASSRADLVRRISALAADPKKARKVRKNVRQWTLVAERVGPVRMPGMPNAFYVDVHSDPKSGAEYVTGAFAGAYRLPYL